jgi:hypothetical protein
MAIGHELLNVPMGDMIRQMAFAIADAQLDLDESSARVAEMMSGYRVLRDADGNLVDATGKASATPVYVDTRVTFGRDAANKPEKLSMMELGFTPTFYQFIETVIEVKIAIRVTRERAYDTKEQTKSNQYRLRSSNGLKVTTTTVDASYSSRYGYSAEGSSLLRTKLVPVPPPPVLEDRIRRMFEQNDKPPTP